MTDANKIETVKAEPLAAKLREIVLIIDEGRYDDAKGTLLAIASRLQEIELLVFGRRS